MRVACPAAGACNPCRGYFVTSSGVAEAIPGCTPTFIEGESHSLLRRHWQSILERVVAAAAAASKHSPGKL